MLLVTKIGIAGTVMDHRAIQVTHNGSTNGAPVALALHDRLLADPIGHQNVDAAILSVANVVDP